MKASTTATLGRRDDRLTVVRFSVRRKKMEKEGTPQEFVRRELLLADLRQTCKQTIEERVDRYLEINHQGIIGNHYFAAASSECINLYRDGHFISAVMASQSVNEAILRFISERSGITAEDHAEIMKLLIQNQIVSEPCATASERIWGSFRNDVHHMNPMVTKIPFKDLAKRNLQDLAVVEKEIFGVDAENLRLIPKQPKYWDIQKDGTVPVFLRLGI
jgi:hypothetical protein